MSEIKILVLEEDAASQSALQTMLDSEGWSVQIVAEVSAVMKELARGSWGLVVASLGVTGLSGPVFTTLLELAKAPPVEDGRSRIRVLFVVPQAVVTQAIPILENDRVPYAVKPFQFNDFMEKINDLLVQAQLLKKTARERGFGSQQPAGGSKGKRGSQERESSMFASRDAYYYTEEELAEYERDQEKEKKKKFGDRQL